jgi:hypothetical protein
MWSSRLSSIALSAGLLLSICASRGLSTTIQYQATDINPTVGLWQYNYFVSDTTFTVNEGFTIFFDYHSFSNLQNPQPAASSDWNAIALQPDLNLPDNGAYDALALVNNPPLTATFQVQFDWFGSGAPGSQPFTINQFDSAGNLVTVLETGNTVPLTPPSTVPEPRAGLLFIVGAGALLLSRRGRRCSTWLIALLALACVAPLSAQQLQVVSRNLVSSARFSRTQFDYTYTVSIQNTGAAAITVTATVTSSSPDTQVIMGNLSFGNVPAGGTVTSTNTMVIRQNRLVPFDPSALSYQFQTGSGPVANAGPDQVVTVGQTAQLDGSGSFDPSGSIVQYSWTYVGSVPSGIALSISGASAVKPTVVISQGGTFTFQLVVTDNHGSVSQPALTHVRTGPIANAGGSQTVNVGQSVQLDGSASFDPSGLPLTFLWTLTAPSGSSARVSDPSAARPTFVADVAGDYTASLTVNNGIATSAPASVSITAISVTGLMACGDVVSGAIKAGGQVDQYRFAGTANAIVTLTLADTAGFDALFGVVAKANVFAPSGKLVVGFNANGQQQLTLAESGTYLVQVQSDDLASTGSYNFGLQCRSPVAQTSTAMSCGSLPQGKLVAAQVDQYTFSGTAGAIVTLTLADTAGFDALFGVVAKANVFAPSGKLVVGFNANGQQQLTLAETGTYLVQVQSDDLASTGSYSLGLQCRSPVAQTSTAMSCGSLPQGKLVAAQVDQYTFSGTAGAIVTLTLADTAGFDALFGVVAKATVFAPSDAVVVSFQADGQQRLTLSEAGTYVVQVESNDLATAGTYGLGLVCSP